MTTEQALNLLYKMHMKLTFENFLQGVFSTQPFQNDDSVIFSPGRIQYAASAKMMTQ